MLKSSPKSNPFVRLLIVDSAQFMFDVVQNYFNKMIRPTNGLHVI